MAVFAEKDLNMLWFGGFMWSSISTFGITRIVSLRFQPRNDFSRWMLHTIFVTYGMLEPKITKVIHRAVSEKLETLWEAGFIKLSSQLRTIQWIISGRNLESVVLSKVEKACDLGSLKEWLVPVKIPLKGATSPLSIRNYCEVIGRNSKFLSFHSF